MADGVFEVTKDAFDKGPMVISKGVHELEGTSKGDIVESTKNRLVPPWIIEQGTPWVRWLRAGRDRCQNRFAICHAGPVKKVHDVQILRKEQTMLVRGHSYTMKETQRPKVLDGEFLT
ncbi:hypothetical protein NE237_002852 [Protea cynaroides]|uniref:Uncharacterized protein n=1 Tax=Protea cynaroides TaxID=273540 RepID=A0A9Q0KFL1_9MAGN|nr:hypothetical protein NE237_002852 [Protea cynaroides]